MPILWGRKQTKDDLRSYCGDLRQLCSATPFQFSDGAESGCRAVRLRNGAGLDMTILTDRGMAIYDVVFRGSQLSFQTAAGPVHPAYSAPFRHTWPAGFMTLCGLTNVGTACVDNGEECPTHGLAGSIPAKEIVSGGAWTSDGDYEIFVQGVIQESRLFGYDLVLTRRISTRIGESVFWIDDTIENRGPRPAPFMLLNHMNIGFPLLDENALLLLPRGETTPRDEAARAGLDSCTAFEPPSDDYNEQVFYHDCQADAEGFVRVALINRQFDQGRGLGVYVQYKKAEYPVLVEWKMMRSGLYVCGIEPANCHVEGRVAERNRGTLVMLEPGEVKAMGLEVGVLSGAKEIDSMESEFEWVEDDTEEGRA